MRFASTLSRVCLFVLSIATGGVLVSADTKTFGATFADDKTGVYVTGGYTVIDNSNFVTDIDGKIGSVTNVRWLFKKTPTLPPTSVFVKVLKQDSTQPWRFTMVDQREIVVREPTADEKASYPQIGNPGDLNYKPAGYRAPSYVDEIYQFWNNPLGITFASLNQNGYFLKTPGQPFDPINPGPPASLPIQEYEFVGFYFPDEFSSVETYLSATPDTAIEWTMPGNFDWKYDQNAPTLHWSPQQRFTFPNPHTNDLEICDNQSALSTPISIATGLANARSEFISDWRQYRSICNKAGKPAFDLTNKEQGYDNAATNEQKWVEGFVSRSKHHDFFQFTVQYQGGGAPPCPSGLCGDPQFSGFQGQNFQFHGMADEVFSLISTPTFQMNGNFKYISAGKCDYNDTMCFTHPGTYVDQIGFMIGDIRIKAIAGSHEAGLRTWMNDVEIHRAHAGNNHKIIFAINNSSTETGSFQYTQSGRLALDLPLFHIEIVNSDYFFNMEVSLKDTNILRAGAKQVKLREKVLCASEGMKSEDRLSHVETRMAKFYPRVPIHGLIGQTWRNSLICDRQWVGDASDYVTSSLFAADSAFNYFGTQQ